MIEIVVSTDSADTKRLFSECSLGYSGESLCVKAMSGNEILGFCLFKITGKMATIEYIEPLQDVLLADGILRSALHVADERGVLEAFYGRGVPEDLLKKLNFIENTENQQLKFNNLFGHCESCNKS